MSNNFGSYIRKARVKAGLGQRELARLVGISAPYLNDLEHSKRKAPSNEILSLLKCKLNLNEEKFNDLAGISKHSLPPDIYKFLFNNSDAVSLVRVLNNLELKFKDFFK